MLCECVCMCVLDRTTDAHLLAWNKGDVNPTLFCSFYQSNIGGGSDSALLLGTGGRFQLKFWKLQGSHRMYVCMYVTSPEQPPPFRCRSQGTV